MTKLPSIGKLKAGLDGLAACKAALQTGGRKRNMTPSTRMWQPAWNANEARPRRQLDNSLG